MGHGLSQESGESNKFSVSPRVLPFKRKLRFVNGTAYLSVPKDYVENFKLVKGQEYQFFLEVPHAE